MKNINNGLRIVFVCIFFLNNSLLNAHGIHNEKFESFWKNNSIKITLFQQQQELKLSQNEMNAFVYNYFSEISNSSNQFWINARKNDTTSAYFNEITKEYLEAKNNIIVKIKNFERNKLQQNLDYKIIIDKYDAVLKSNALNTPGSLCENPGFENNSTLNWDVWLGDACLYDVTLSCNNFALSNFGAAIGASRIEILTTPAFDPFVPNNRLPVICPTGGNTSVRMENTVNGGNATQLKYTFLVDPQKPIYSYKFALVLEEPTNPHLLEEKPFFLVTFFDKTTNENIECGRYSVVADGEDIEFKNNDIFMPITPGSSTKFTNWQTKSMDFIDRPNHEIEVTFTVSDCALGGHFGYAYIDGDCVTDPITVGPCLAGGVRQLSVAGVFSDYQWKGNGIVGANKGTTIKIDKDGKYTLLRKSGNKCRSVESVIVNPCPVSPSPPPCQISINSHSIMACNSNNNLFDLELNFTVNNAPSNSVIKIQDGIVSHFIYSPFSSPHQFILPNLYADGKTHHIQISLFKDNYIADLAELCTQYIDIQAPSPCFTPLFPISNSCIGSFAPCPQATYVISAWVKEPNAPSGTSTYSNPHINLLYSGSSPNPPAIFASGKIIEGWQRIYYEFTIPIGTTALDIQLNTASGTALFDDIRIYPVNSSMKSYVYDPVSLKLVAELDENNYATFYEYDEEGTLIRTKKETERGIVTITENRQSNPKK